MGSCAKAFGRLADLGVGAEAAGISSTKARPNSVPVASGCVFLFSQTYATSY